MKSKGRVFKLIKPKARKVYEVRYTCPQTGQWRKKSTKTGNRANAELYLQEFRANLEARDLLGIPEHVPIRDLDYVPSVKQPGKSGTTPGVIYFIEAVGLHKVKVGWSSKLTRRIASLITSLPVECRVLGFLKGTELLERQLHDRFARYHCKHEWFFLSGEIQSYIKNHTTKAPRDWQDLAFDLELERDNERSRELAEQMWEIHRNAKSDDGAQSDQATSTVHGPNEERMTD